jgi:3,4-dihydroxy-9,10-secoandrosta-1,3,5(10)-triene-9,17-dione 4,5-dioxygenase
MVSFYIATPSSIQIEYGYGGYVVNDQTWTARTYSSPTIWGHARSERAINNPPGIVWPVERAEVEA